MRTVRKLIFKYYRRNADVGKPAWEGGLQQPKLPSFADQASNPTDLERGSRVDRLSVAAHHSWCPELAESEFGFCGNTSDRVHHGE
jgi:hypothetical protein